MRSRSKFNIDSIKIASPCSARWDDMKGDERARVCADCSLQVFNTAELSRTEIERLIADRTGKRLCLRLHRRPDGTLITKNCPVGFRKTVHRAVRFAGAALSVILGVAAAGFGQDKPSGSQTKEVMTTSSSRGRIVVEGTVMDADGAVIVATRIEVFSPGNKKPLIQTQPNAKGRFRLEFPNAGKYLIKAGEGHFFNGREIELVINSDKNDDIEIVLEPKDDPGILTGPVDSLPFPVEITPTEIGPLPKIPINESFANKP